MELILRASLVQLKNLFRLRDDVKDLLEEVSDVEIDLSTLLALSLEFFLQFLQSNEVDLSKILDHYEEASGLGLNPIKISFGDASGEEDEERIAVNQKRLSEVRNHLKDHFGGLRDVSEFCILNFTFRFLLSKRGDILSYFTSSSHKTEDNVPCEICGDLGLRPKEFCDALVCGKCTSFFIETYEKRKELKCLKFGNCRLNEGRILDISCSPCRMNRCTALGLVDKYDPCPNKESNCTLCEALGTHKKFQGVPSVCFQCKNILREATKIPDIRCTSLSADVFDLTCEHCLIQRFKHLKDESMDEDETSLSKRRCLGCDVALSTNNYTPELDLRWNGCLCKVCETFVLMSMTTAARKYYSCPSGELGDLCDIVPDTENSWTQKCNYCWLRILEIGGVIELWGINENPVSLMRH
eukprot:TRINITY_DN7147_c0_g1_i1.p1 TRINITY_DN7147_c0_g1~~TRINITY_DN7147_c0_g1_i1.p1  ORF type:complete len:419 (+),score=74.29 TRINITY_DN7147_c0_g1_i1:24-1259(+)